VFGLNWDCDSLGAKYARIYLPAGAERCSSWEWDPMEEKAAEMIPLLFGLKDEIEASNSDVTMYFSFPSLDIFFDYYLNQHDLPLLGLSFGLVFIVLWVNTNSIFLSFCGMFEILVSFPLGLFIWLVLLQQPGVTYLMYNGIFIILGIGCDDIFVFLDAFRQSELEPPHISGTLETRFAWAYNRAAGAMLATSLTTCLAFLGCAISQIWDIRCFGVVNGMMVLFDYLLVITWFPAAVIVYERHFKDCAKSCSFHALLEWCKTKCGKTSATEEDVPEGHFFEIFFGGPFATFVVDYKKSVVALFTVLLIVSTAVWSPKSDLDAAQLKPSTKSFTFFDEDHYYERMKGVMEDKFNYASADGKMQITMAFGLKSNDPWCDDDLCGVHPTTISEGELYEDTEQTANYKNGFDLFDYQQAFSDASKEFHDQLVSKGHATEDDGYYCWIDDFKRWAKLTHGLPYPYTDRAAFANNVSAWLSAPREEGFSWRNRTEWKYENYKGGIRDDYYYTGFDVHDGVVRFAFTLFNTTYEMKENGYPSAFMWDLYEDAEDALKSAESVSGMNNGIQTMSQYNIMALGAYLESSAYQNMIAGLCLAVVVILIFTNNWWLTALCALALYSIISLVFCEMGRLRFIITLESSFQLCSHMP